MSKQIIKSEVSTDGYRKIELVHNVKFKRYSVIHYHRIDKELDFQETVNMKMGFYELGNAEEKFEELLNNTPEFISSSR